MVAIRQSLPGAKNSVPGILAPEQAPLHLCNTAREPREFAVTTATALEKADGFAAGAGLEAAFGAPVRNIDDMHRAVALAGDEQFVAAECHVHRLRADLDRGLLAKRRIDQAHRVAVEAGDAEQAVVRRVA